MTDAHFAWSWGGRALHAAYETIGPAGPGGEGEPGGADARVLLLPAFSTVSTREEMRPLARLLSQAGFSCTLLDWPGFGASSRGRRDYGPDFYRAFLGALAAATMPAGSAVIAAGHASGYALQAGRNHPGLWGRVVLLAPTWRGPLPTAMGPRARTYAFARRVVRLPVIGEALYRLNTHPAVIGMMYRRHVYADAASVTPAFVDAKRATARGRGARFASVAFVTGALDPLADAAGFQALLTPPPAPVLILCGEQTPPKSKAAMAAILSGPDVRVAWVPGSLGLNEERAAEIGPMIAAFLGSGPG